MTVIKKKNLSYIGQKTQRKTQEIFGIHHCMLAGQTRKPGSVYPKGTPQKILFGEIK